MAHREVPVYDPSQSEPEVTEFPPRSDPANEQRSTAEQRANAHTSSSSSCCCKKLGWCARPKEVGRQDSVGAAPFEAGAELHSWDAERVGDM